MSWCPWPFPSPPHCTLNLMSITMPTTFLFSFTLSEHFFSCTLLFTVIIIESMRFDFPSYSFLLIPNGHLTPFSSLFFSSTTNHFVAIFARMSFALSLFNYFFPFICPFPCTFDICSHPPSFSHIVSFLLFIFRLHSSNSPHISWSLSFSWIQFDAASFLLRANNHFFFLSFIRDHRHVQSVSRFLFSLQTLPAPCFSSWKLMCLVSTPRK